MKIATLLAIIGCFVVSTILYLQHDLRGWTPDDQHNSDTLVKASRQGESDFALSACLPGTIEPWNPPSAEEYSGSATLTVLTCRSRISAAVIMLSYLGGVALVYLILCAIRRRQRP